MNTLKIPYYVIIGVNVLTWIIYVSNPFVSLTSHHILTIFYVLLNILCISWGFTSGLKKGEILTPKSKFLSDVAPSFFNKFIIFYLLTFLLKYAYELHCPLFDIGAMVNRTLMGIANPYYGYTASRTYFPLPWSVYVLICIFDGLFFIVGMLCWSKLSKGTKTVFVFLTAIDVFKNMGFGSSFAMLKFLTTLAMIISANYWGDNNRKLDKRAVITTIIGIFILAVFIFGRNMESRVGGSFADAAVDDATFNENSFINKYLISFFSERIQNFYIYVSSYLTQGYYNLECMFDCDYDWCFFFGHTDSFGGLLSMLGIDVEKINYQTKIFQQFGVDPYIHWHSCYLWLANDVTYFGVPIVVYYVSKMCASALVLYRNYNDMLSGIIFVLYANMMIYFFANNNFLSNIYYSYIVVLPIWIFTRYKVNEY